MNVVTGQRAFILKLLSGEDQALVVRWNFLFVLNFRLDIVDGVGSVYVHSDGLAC